MNGNLPTWREHFRRMSPAYLVLLLSLIPTLIAYRRVRENVAMRAGGFPDYALRADAEREEYFPMIYLSSATNSPNWAPGWDLLNEPKRGVAMELARQADRPMATEKVMLFTPEGPKAGPGLV